MLTRTKYALSASAAILAFGLAGCSSTVDTVKKELELRGFVDPVMYDSHITASSDSQSWYVGYGGCRLTVQYLTGFSLYGDEGMYLQEPYVEDPSVAALDQLSGLQYCRDSTPPSPPAD